MISGNEAGLLGYNGTELECHYIQERLLEVLYVSFVTFNRSSNFFETIATYRQDTTPQLNTQGQYLNGRVTLTPLTKLSAKAVMTFNKLMCIDDTFYRCRVIYFDTNGFHDYISSNISISVQGM